MKTTFRLLLILIFAQPFIGSSQISFYSFSETSGNTYASIATTGTSVTLTDDSDSQQNIGFNFTYNGVTYTQLKISSNGWCRLGTASATSGTGNLGGFSEAIAPFFDDLNPSDAGSIYYETQGTTPNRVFIVEYDGVQKYGSTAAGITLTAQAVFFEASNNIEFRYGASVGAFNGGSIGISEDPLGAGHIMSVTPGTPSTVSTATVNSAITAVPATGTNYLFTYTPPACPAPTSPMVSSIGTTSIQLNWVSGGSNNYNVEYGPAGFTQGAGTIVNVVTDTFVVISALSTGTAYDWYVQDSCGVNDVSLWTAVNSFSTNCVTYNTFPYTYGFDNLTPNNGSISCATTYDLAGTCYVNDLTSDDKYWVVRSNSTGSGSTGPSADNSGSGNYIFLETSTCYGKTANLTTPDFDISSLATPRLSFFYHMYGATMGSLKVIVSSDAGNTWPDTLLTISGDQGDMWINATVDLTAYNTVTSLKIKFQGFTGTSYTSDMALDDISIFEPLNDDVEVLEVLGSFGAIGQETYTVKAVIKNNGLNSQSNFPLNYMLQGGTAVTETVTSIASNAIDTFTFVTALTSNGATANAELAVYSTITGDQDITNDTAYSEVISLQLPYFEGFESFETNDVADYWSIINTTGSTSAYAYVSTSAHTGSRSFKMYNSSLVTDELMIILPKDNSTSGVSAKYLKFWSKGGTAQNLIIGVLSDLSDASTFVGVDTVAVPSSYTEFVIDLSSYTGTGKFVAFKHDMAATYDTYYIDDVTYYVPLQNDVSTSSIELDSETSCENTTFEFDAIFTNNGTIAQSNIPVSAVITNPNGFSTTLTAATATLASLVSDTVTFSSVDVTLPGIYTVQVIASLTGDQDASNDTIFTSFELLSPLALDFVEDFEVSSPDWDLSGMSRSSSHGKTGYGLYKNFYGSNNYGTAFMNKKLGAVTSGSSLVFDYKIKNYSGSTPTDLAGDEFYFVVSSDCGVTFDTLFTIDSTSHTATANWTAKQISLSSYVNDNVIIGFIGTLDAGDYYFELDNFGIATPPMVSLGPDTAVCLGETLTLDLGANSGYSYLWTANGDTVSNTTNTFIVDTVGTYTVEVFNSIGMAYDTIMVSYNALPVVSFSGLDTMYCANEMAVMLMGTPAGGTYTGMGITGDSFDPFTAGPGDHAITYTFTDNNGCTNYTMDTTMVKDAPMAMVTMDSEICEGESVDLNSAPMVSAPSVFFSMYIEGSSNNKGLEIFNATSDTVNLDNYRIAQASNGNGWSYYHTFPAGAKLAPNMGWVMVTDQVDPTMYDTTLADEVLGYPSLVHFNGDDARAIEYTTDGGTTWMMTDIFGDPDNDPGSAWDVAGVTNATKDHSLIRKSTVVGGSLIWANIAGTDAMNSEYEVLPKNTFAGLGNHMVTPPSPSTDTYLWSNGDATAMITVMPTTTTTYYVTVSNPGMDCDDIDSVTITVKPMPVVDLGPDATIKWTTGTINLDAGNAGATYLWSTLETTQIVTYDNTNLANGSTNTISVDVDLNGCVATDEVIITMQDDVSIGEAFENANVEIYPNPTNGQFDMTIEGVNANFNMQIINVTGEVVYSERMNATAKFTKSFDVSEFAAGVYYVRLSNNDGIVVKKLVIK